VTFPTRQNQGDAPRKARRALGLLSTNNQTQKRLWQMTCNRYVHTGNVNDHHLLILDIRLHRATIIILFCVISVCASACHDGDHRIIGIWCEYVLFAVRGASVRTTRICANIICSLPKKTTELTWTLISSHFFSFYWLALSRSSKQAFFHKIPWLLGKFRLVWRALRFGACFHGFVQCHFFYQVH